MTLSLLFSLLFSCLYLDQLSFCEYNLPIIADDCASGPKPTDLFPLAIVSVFACSSVRLFQCSIVSVLFSFEG
jgi:hypothetical protein